MIVLKTLSVTVQIFFLNLEDYTYETDYFLCSSEHEASPRGRPGI